MTTTTDQLARTLYAVYHGTSEAGIDILPADCAERKAWARLAEAVNRMINKGE